MLFGDAIRSRREELGMSQAQLAARLSTTQQTVSRWENGLAVPRPGRAVLLATELGIDAAELQRLAGHLVRAERSDAWPRVEEVLAQVSALTEMELMLLIDGAWAELRRRTALPSDAPPRSRR